ncbi:hypothetical protein [uncultured Fusobacterium sp.]|jgi:hypothetical protein|uniref:hypothetical protein n=1 Tax=uncultured Fusobacterium sp. TaxID=159267 RepID=UPI0026190794|nr:hypothetical protein [uncultured Fusobacterium sp.]
MNWLNENKEWIFSGIGVLLISWIFNIILKVMKKNNNKSTTQISGNNSAQIINNEGNITINNSLNGKDKKNDR